MPKNIKSIKLWDNNPDKSRVSNVVRIEFNFPCTWTILDINDLKVILREWIKGEEIKYPREMGFKGRWMLYDEITKLFEEDKSSQNKLKIYGDEKYGKKKDGVN